MAADAKEDGLAVKTTPARTRGPSKAQQLNKIYTLPAPVRTFPLPTFIPHNPVSLLHLVYVWLSQTINPPSSHPEVLHQGVFSYASRSIHVTDPKTIRDLWEQGFYGKGSLSRSEPSWMDREKRRTGAQASRTSEEVTRQRRVDRQQAKWERARKEREVIEQILRDEQAQPPTTLDALSQNQKSNTEFEQKQPEKPDLPTPSPSPEPHLSVASGARYTHFHKLQTLSVAPVGPLELLALPNSDSETNGLSFVLRGESVAQSMSSNYNIAAMGSEGYTFVSPVGPLELLALPNSDRNPSAETKTPLGTHRLSKATHTDVYDIPTKSISANASDQSPEDDGVGDRHPKLNGSVVIPTSIDVPALQGDIQTITPPSSPKKLKLQKCVRFSPTVEQNTFLQSEPPSPELAAAATIDEEDEKKEKAVVLEDKEHLQLTLEEAFFLSYGLGVLTVIDPDHQQPIPHDALLSLFRRHSHFPPQSPTQSPNLSSSPDDPFMVSYAVYHHFRSLGWVVRGGTKFSVDYLLYNRGPVFAHAEFAVVVLPSYSDPYWTADPFLEQYVRRRQGRGRSWAWLHGVNRVNTQVKKTIILAYVDIPPPMKGEGAGIDEVFGRYKIREVVMKRWLSNRSRD